MMQSPKANMGLNVRFEVNDRKGQIDKDKRLYLEFEEEQNNNPLGSRTGRDDIVSPPKKTPWSEIAKVVLPSWQTRTFRLLKEKILFQHQSPELKLNKQLKSLKSARSRSSARKFNDVQSQFGKSTRNLVVNLNNNNG
jgi:hypothetical protein